MDQLECSDITTNGTYPLLEHLHITRAESVCFGNDGNEVDSGTQTLHRLDVKRLQSVSGWSDEVETRMYSKVDLVGTAWLLFLEHVRFMLVVEEFNDGLPRIAVVDIVSKSRSVNDCEADFDWSASHVLTWISSAYL
jgi:hypothetical protein